MNAKSQSNKLKYIEQLKIINEVVHPLIRDNFKSSRV